MRKPTRTDVDIVIFRRSRGNGGQHNNKTSTACRMTHKATGVRVEACKERSREANIEAAYESLATELERMEKAEKDAAKKAIYSAKPDAGFGAKDRTYNFIDRRVVDHRTGHESNDLRSVLGGGINEFIEASMIAEANR